MMSGFSPTTVAISRGNFGNSTNSPVLCVIKTGAHITSLQVQASISVILLPINLFLLICLIVQRKRLRTRLVCMYGLNVVFASTLASVMRVYDTFSQNFGRPYLGQQFLSNITLSESYLYWWAFEKSTLVMLFLVFYASIAMITMALHTTMLRITCTVAGVSVRKNIPSPQQNRFSLVTKFKQLSKAAKARLAIAVSWILPCTIILISVTVDNCSKEYLCPFDYEKENEEPENLRQSCARDLSPLSNNTVYITLGLCMISLVVLTCALLRSYIDYRRISAELSQHKHHVFHLTRENSLEQNGNDVDSTSDVTQVESKQQNTHKAGGMLLAKTKRDLLSIFIISVIYVSGTMASIFFVFIDSMTEFYKSPEAFYVKLFFLNLPNVVETISSVLLCVCIHPISSAIKATLRKVSTTCCPCLYRFH